MYIKRDASAHIQDVLQRKKSILLLGPRQTGKTTLISQLSFDLMVTFSDPRVRQRYEKNPGVLIDEIEAWPESCPLVIIDEVQKVPEIMDAAQYLIDKKQAQFILTGSSARKLKRHDDINLLPGRVIPIYLDALLLDELPASACQLDQLLMYGGLPEIILSDGKHEKEELLEAYVVTYLEEEVRAEALVRNLASFSRFLELAAGESGYLMNASKLSQTVGVSASTIHAYYQILEDCLIIHRVEPILHSKTRHRLSKTQKYIFFDLGVRRLAAREGLQPPMKYKGHLFEQFIGIELLKMSRFSNYRMSLRYWKDANGPEVDWVLEMDKKLIPIEVKLTDKPSLHDARHLNVFLGEYPEAVCGFVVCTTPNPMQLSDRIRAISWQSLQLIISELQAAA